MDSRAHSPGDRGHRAHAQRGLHRRQPFAAGQRHRDPPRRRAGARDLSIAQAAQPLERAPDGLRWKNGGVLARGRTQRSSYGELVAQRVAARRGRAAIETEGRARLPRDGQAGAARRHPRESHRRRRLRAGPAPARHAARARRASAELWREARVGGHGAQSRGCRGASSRARGRLPRGGRRARVPRDPGHERASARGALAGERGAAGRGRALCHFAARAPRAATP